MLKYPKSCLQLPRQTDSNSTSSNIIKPDYESIFCRIISFYCGNQDLDCLSMKKKKGNRVIDYKLFIAFCLLLAPIPIGAYLGRGLV